MEVEEWYVGKSPGYVEATKKFVESFGDDADLDNDVEPDHSNPDDDPNTRRIARDAVADFIHALHPQDATYFVDDAFAALSTQRENDRIDDDAQYGHLNEYGEPRDQNNEEN